MGASASKPSVPEYAKAEKVGFPTTSTSTAPTSTPAAPRKHLHAHHSLDRLARITAEMSLSGSGSGNDDDRVRTKAHLSRAALDSWAADAMRAPESRVAALTMHNADIALSVRRRDAEVAVNHVFSHSIKLEAPVCNQANSGRCWLFATMNVLRAQVMQQYDVKDFELSQSFLHFYDKLEKANTFLENSIDLADVPVDDRIYGYLKTEPVNDGGQWDMVVNLLCKYGVVPKQVFPETASSSSSGRINWLLTVKLREYALELRALVASTNSRLAALSEHDRARAVVNAARTRKDAQMKEVYRIMAIALGTPPKPDTEFTWEYVNTKGEFRRLTTTSRKFLKSVKTFNPKEACSLVNDPRRAYDKLITIDRLQNVWGGEPVLYVNTTSEQMKACVVASIKAGHSVFFGCDVSKFTHSASGVMATELYDYETPFGIKLGLSKAERLDMGESSMDHAMTLQAVHLDENGKPVRFRIENSWGEEYGDKGYFTMTDKWFDDWVYQVVIRKEHMPSKLWNIFARGIDKDTDVLPPYDPMGTLA